MAWFLRQYEGGDPKGEWTPMVTYANGKSEVPVWLPLPGSQYSFLECPIFETIFEGTRGPGKTLTLIMDFAKEVGKGYGRSEERRVGKGWVSTGRSRWSRYHEKKKEH